MSFSFSFAGEDIDIDDANTAHSHASASPTPSGVTTSPRRSTSAFPVAGQAQLPACEHSVDELLSSLPSTIAYGTLHVSLDDGSSIALPRRELWDVRVQLMAEAEMEDGEKSSIKPGLGNEDVKTGVYEGGFKSWECAVDLVRVLAERRKSGAIDGGRILELGCGTALPSLALFQWHLRARLNDTTDSTSRPALHLLLADYNPTVLQLVTLPNLLLSWALIIRGQEAWEAESELDISPGLLEELLESLRQCGITLSFFSGGWSSDFVHMVQTRMNSLVSNESGTISSSNLLLLGAETIYSPMALHAFTETMMEILNTESRSQMKNSDQKASIQALVGAKKVYFGVGGSIEDFYQAVLVNSGTFEQIREESDGVRRVAVEVRSDIQ